MKQILHFTSPTCTHCQTTKPIIESIQKKIPIIEINVDANPQSAKVWGVSSIPTTLIILSGTELGRIVGVASEEKIIALYNR